MLPQDGPTAVNMLAHLWRENLCPVRLAREGGIVTS